MKRFGWLLLVGFVLAVGIIVAVAGTLRPSTKGAAPGTTAAPTTVTTINEAASDWPCELFRSVAGDVNAGILTDAELRDKLKEVNERAVLGTEEIQAAAVELLAASTAGDVPGIRAGFARMNAACTATGH